MLFEHEDDARRVLGALAKRLEKYSRVRESRMPGSVGAAGG